MRATTKVKQRLAGARRTHTSGYTLANGLRTWLRQQKFKSLEEVADLAYVLKQIVELLNDLRKEYENTQLLAEKIACMGWVQGDRPGPIRGKLCTATPRVRSLPSLPSPKTDPEAYHRLMDFLDVGDECRESVRLHWPGLVEMLERLQAEGKPLPPGIDPQKVYSEWRLTMREKKPRA